LIHEDTVPLALSSPAICLPPCVNGVCHRPDTCTCEPGWTDGRCRI